MISPALALLTGCIAAAVFLIPAAIAGGYLAHVWHRHRARILSALQGKGV